MSLIVLLWKLALISITLAALILRAALLLRKKLAKDTEKQSPFECGLTPQQECRNPFSLHFFIIAIVFLIFDIELIILLPLILGGLLNNIARAAYVLFAAIALALGVFFEWSQKTLC